LVIFPYSLVFFLLPRPGHRRDLHSFPTRRSSDLACRGCALLSSVLCSLIGCAGVGGRQGEHGDLLLGGVRGCCGQGSFQLVSLLDRKSTRLNSSHVTISSAVF